MTFRTDVRLRPSTDAIVDEIRLVARRVLRKRSIARAASLLSTATMIGLIANVIRTTIRGSPAEVGQDGLLPTTKPNTDEQCLRDILGIFSDLQ